MDVKKFKAGRYSNGYEYRYFIPALINHSFSWTSETAINGLLEQASRKMGELNSFSRFVPDTDMFIIMHIFKEAVVSSRIEGTRTSIEEVLIEAEDVEPERREDWQEVQNYVRAMNGALEQLKTLPLSNRLIRNAHGILLSGVRGEHKTPGEFRRSQNWIGGTALTDAVFVPPHHNELPELLADFESFLHNTEVDVPHLVRIAIAHYQFETIHPFLDGNGRVGRLLIALYLVSAGMLDKPLLYLSEFFEKNKGLYYDNLTRVRTHNDLVQWIKFFLTGIVQTAESATGTLKKIVDLKARLETEHIIAMGKRSRQAALLLHQLFNKPTISVKDAQRMTHLSAKAANDLVRVFIEHGILTEVTGQHRYRLFVFTEYLRLFT